MYNPSKSVVVVPKYGLVSMPMRETSKNFQKWKVSLMYNKNTTAMNIRVL